MSKVKLTQEQAEEIRKIEDVDYAINILSLNKRPDNPLAELTIAEIARALYVGYEVEPEFKVGDWVIVFHENGIWKCTAKITKISGNLFNVDEKNIHGEDLLLSFDGWDVIRHATPSEIAEEKERRWWKKHGRDVWGLRVRDILKQKRGNELVEVKEVHNSGYLIGKWTCYERKEYIKKHYTVVCLAENRLDVNANGNS